MNFEGNSEEEMAKENTCSQSKASAGLTSPSMPLKGKSHIQSNADMNDIDSDLANKESL